MRKIEIKELSFSYGKQLVLKDINLTINEGDYIAIIGPNGGGKTTFVKLLLGLREPNSGSIEIFGKSPKEARGLVGYLPQYINFNMDMPISVEDIVLQGRMKKGKIFFDKKDREMVDEELEKMGLTHLKKRKVKELSGGERQRVLLARSLVKKPDILILDEPTASIDLEGQKEIYRLLSSLPQTKIIISHDINILFEGINRIAHINKTLHLHDSLPTTLKRGDGHFCEMELLELLRDSRD